MSRNMLPGFTVLCVGYLVFFLLFAFELAIMHIFASDTAQALYLLFEHSTIDGAFLYGSWLLLSARFGRRASLADMGLTGCPAWLFSYVPLCFLLVLVAQGAWVMLLSLWHTAPLHFPTLASFSIYMQKPATDTASIFIFCILAPVAEEVLFRGLIFRWLLQKYSLLTAVIVSALFFALMHADMLGFVDYLVVGICCALLVYYAKSLWPAIALHILVNSLAIAFLFLR